MLRFTRIEAPKSWECRVACGLLLLGCAASPEPTRPAPAHGPHLEFGFSGGGETIDSTTTRGRATVILFLTTYDFASQFAARQLAEIIRSFKPRANALAVVLEEAQYEPLLPAYRQTLDLPFPVVMADIATQQGESAFGAIPVVPTLVVLDRDGREVWRHPGATTRAEIMSALDRAARAGR